MNLVTAAPPPPGGPRERIGRRLTSPSWLAVAALLLAVVVPCWPEGEAGGDETSWEDGKQAVQEMIDQRKFAEAEAQACSLLARAERDHGPSSTRAAEAIDLLVKVLVERRRGREPGTRALAERAVATKERALGPDHVDTAASLNTLARLLFPLEGPASARPVFERVVRIREKALGSDHLDVARGLNNLSICLTELGDYAAARRALERSLRILEQGLGPDHHDTAIVRHSLASLLRRMGDYAAARSHYERNLEFQERAHGSESGECGECMGTLNNLANLLKDLGELEESRRIHERILRWLEAQPDARPEHALLNLAHVLRLMGNLEGARSLAERALSIRLELLAGGAEDVQAAKERVLLGEILTESGHPGEARDHFERGIEAQNRFLGPAHPDLADSLGGYARMLWTLGEVQRAMGKALRVEEMARRHFLEVAGSLTEREALLLASVRISGRDLALSALAAQAGAGGSPPDARRAWDQVARSRALVLDVVASRQRMARSARDPEVDALLEALETARRRLSWHLVTGPEAGAAEGYAKKLAALREEKERAERAVAERSAVFRRQVERERLGLDEVLAALPPDSALVAYVLYNRIPPAPAGQAAPSSLADSRKVPSYLALVARQGLDFPLVVPLGASSDIDRLIHAYAEAVGRRPGSPAAVAHARNAGEALRKSIWDPIVRGLAGAKLVFIVPDGAMHHLNISTLPSEPDRYLVETGPLLHHLSAERDLVRLKTQEARGNGLLALGGPDFETRAPQEVGAAVSVATLASQFSSGTGSHAPTYRSPPAACGEMRSLRFESLVAARHEVDEVESLWRARARAGAAQASGSDAAIGLTGAGASEASFKRWAPGRRVLHVATHGFFMQEACGASLEGSSPATPPSRHPGGGAATRGSADSFLHLSGLALAGANRRHELLLEGGEEDGILTAEEILSLDLSGVEWAVLSACATGLGAVQSGEGILGLRRAFEIAGASTVITSLWAVEDDATRAWMRRLYEARLAGLSTAASVRKASLDLLESQRRRGRTTHPFFWGAFVAAGDWR